MKLYQIPAIAVFLVAWVGQLLLGGCAENPSASRSTVESSPPSRAASTSVQRIALVIGNGKYKDSPLTNPPNDARAMAQVLNEIGFRVTELQDVSLKDMNAAVRAFGDQLRKGGGVGLFYYAGHGIQIRGRNFLVPVDADIKREDEVPYASFDVSIVLDKMESAGNGTNILILDACRNNPFARSFRSATSGLAQMDAPVGTYVSFATAPGRVASDGGGVNGLYTQHLIDNIRLPGLKIEDVFKRARVGVMNDSEGQQVPWDNSSLTGDFYFVPARPSDAMADAPKPPAPPVAAPAPITYAELVRTPTQASRPERPVVAPAKTAESSPRENPAKVTQPTQPTAPKTKPTQIASLAPGLSSQTPPGQSTKDVARKSKDSKKENQGSAAAEQPVTPAADDLFHQGQEAQNKMNTKGAADFYEQAVEHGHPAAAYELGQLYKVGRRPLPQDLSKARALFAKAAAGNNVPGEYQYGFMLDQGLGGEKNCKEGQKWLQRAAEHGVVEAMTALGDSLLRLCNGEKNLPMAAKWFRTAADKSSVTAEFSLGILYFNGDGVEKNPAEAKKWFGLAASQGHPSAKFYLDRLN